MNSELPPKLDDPGKFSIPCIIGKATIKKALCDLGASVSLMPHTIFDRLGMGELKPTRMSLQLADSSVRLPLGIVEDVPVQVGKYYVPVDFVVIEIEDDKEVPIILGRPFLRTAGAIIDVFQGTLTLNFGWEKVRFQIDCVMKYPSPVKSCFRIDAIEYCLTDLAEGYLLEQIYKSRDEHANFWSKMQDEATKLGSVHGADVESEDLGKPRCDPHGPNASRIHKPEDLETRESESDETNATSACESSAPDATHVKTQPKGMIPELKPLPTNLRYEFLGPDRSFPVIISADLNPDQTAKLLEKLKLHQDAIGYSINDLRGISPSICSHRIFLEDDHKPSVEHLATAQPQSERGSQERDFQIS